LKFFVFTQHATNLIKNIGQRLQNYNQILNHILFFVLRVIDLFQKLGELFCSDLIGASHVFTFEEVRKQEESPNPLISKESINFR